MKGWKKLTKVISDSQSSIPEKRKGGENYLKSLVHEFTDGAAYPEKGPATEESDEMMVVPTTVTEEVKKEAVLITETEEMIQTDLSLKLGMLTYIERNKLDIPPAVTTAIANAKSSTEVVEALAPLGDPVLNAQMLHWAIHNSSSDHTAKDLKTVVFAHLAEHSDHYEALSGLLTETNVNTLAHGLIESGFGELAGEVIEFFLAEA